MPLAPLLGREASHADIQATADGTTGIPVPERGMLQHGAIELDRVDAVMTPRPRLRGQGRAVFEQLELYAGRSRFVELFAGRDLPLSAPVKEDVHGCLADAYDIPVAPVRVIGMANDRQGSTR